MALEAATYINQLQPANPLSTDVVAQADDHLRLIKQVLVNTFPNITGPVTATQDHLNTPVPVGLIAMWSGASSAIPTGWLLCNGTNGTPDLRDRFIVGAGSSYAVGATGGADSVTLTSNQIPSHTHVITATADTTGAHAHTLTDPGHTHAYTVVSGAGGIGGGYNYGQVQTSTASATTGITMASAGSHTHAITATAATTGGGQSHENRPPYYALCFIMKG